MRKRRLRRAAASSRAAVVFCRSCEPASFMKRLRKSSRCRRIKITNIAMMPVVVSGMTVDKVMRTKEVTLPLFGTMASWRVTFIVVGVPGLLFALLMLTVREPLRRHLKALELPSKFNLAQSVKAIRDRWQTMAGISVGMVFQAACNYGFMAWAPTFFQRVHGWTPGEAGRALGITVITWGIAGMYCRRLADRPHVPPRHLRSFAEAGRSERSRVRLVYRPGDDR